MKDKSKRPIWLRALNALCVIALLCSITFMLIAGFHFAAIAVVALSLASIATPVVVSGEGIVEMVTGIVEALVDGVIAIIEAIANAIAGIFG